jgi:hypothetical protein
VVPVVTLGYSKGHTLSRTKPHPIQAVTNPSVIVDVSNIEPDGPSGAAAVIHGLMHATECLQQNPFEDPREVTSRAARELRANYASHVVDPESLLLVNSLERMRRNYLGEAGFVLTDTPPDIETRDAQTGLVGWMQAQERLVNVPHGQRR